MAHLMVHPSIVCHKRKTWAQIARELKDSTGKTVTVVKGKLVLWEKQNED